MIFHQSHNSKSSYNYNAFFYTNEIWDFHFHKNLELIYVEKGSVECTVNNTVYTLNPDDFGLCCLMIYTPTSRRKTHFIG